LERKFRILIRNRLGLIHIQILLICLKKRRFKSRWLPSSIFKITNWPRLQQHNSRNRFYNLRDNVLVSQFPKSEIIHPKILKSGRLLSQNFSLTFTNENYKGSQKHYKITLQRYDFESRSLQNRYKRWIDVAC
jgi:hypothetical protein